MGSHHLAKRRKRQSRILREVIQVQMNHSRAERTNVGHVPAIWKCVDCGREMTTKELTTVECDAVEKTSQEQALIDAIEQRSDSE